MNAENRKSKEEVMEENKDRERKEEKGNISERGAECKDKKGEGRSKEEEEVKRRVGRPKKVEELIMKERRSSLGSIEEYMKRKRGEEGEEGEERRELRRSKKMENVQGEKGVEMEELRKVVSEELRKVMREEIGELRKEMWRREEEWRKEKKEMSDKIKEMERRMRDVEERIERGEKRREEGVGEGYRCKEVDEEVAGKVRGIGRRMEMKEREERRNNIVIKRMKEGEGDLRERVGKLLEEIGVKVEVEWVRKVRGKEGGGGEMVVARLGSREQKRQVMEGKRELRGRRERIEDDLTWEERRMKWRLAEIAEEERRKGNRVWTGYGKIRINEIWWRWSEEEGCLRNWKGEKREDRKEKGEEK